MVQAAIRAAEPGSEGEGDVLYGNNRTTRRAKALTGACLAVGAMALGSAAGDFSVTGHFTINTHDITGGFNGGVDIAAVPGPLVGAGIPGLLALLGGMYAFYRRRRA